MAQAAMARSTTLRSRDASSPNWLAIGMKVAAEIGNAEAARAVGRANATNPICLLVPCHRVIGTDGSLTGFAFGEDIKRQLLDHERTLAAV